MGGFSSSLATALGSVETGAQGEDGGAAAGVTSFNGLTGAITYYPTVRCDGVDTGAVKLSTLASAAYGAGQTAWVEKLQAAFVLIQSADAAVPLVLVAASGKSGYLWQRVIGRAPVWEVQTVWRLDGTNGNDENTGRVGSPLKTNAELTRRLTGALIGSTTITYDVSSTDALRLNGTFASGTVTLQGVVTVVQTKTVASAQARDAATNKANEITVTGFDFSPYVGYLLRLQATPTSVAVITKAPSLGVARLGELFNSNTGVRVSTTGVAAAAVVEIIDQTAGPSTILIGGNIGTPVIQDLQFATPRIRYNGHGTNPIATRCRFTGSAMILGCTDGITFWSSSFAGGISSAVGEAALFNGCAFIGTGATQYALGFRTNIFNGLVCQGAQVAIQDWAGSYFKSGGDLGIFDLTGANAGLLLSVGARANFLCNYYGAGNSASGFVVQLLDMAQWHYNVKPTMNAALGVSTPAGNVAVAALPIALNGTYGHAAYGP